MKKAIIINNYPLQNSLIACMHGCLKYLGQEVPIGWLYGAMGFAFIINIHTELDPSGPTAWIWGKEWLSRMAANIGCRIDGVFAFASDDSFPEKQKLAWEHVRSALESNTPCFGWNIGDIPDFFLIDGYDDKGYYSRMLYPNYDYDNTDIISRYTNPTSYPVEQGPVPWKALGTHEYRVLAVYSVRLTEPKDEKTTIREALRFAIGFAEGKYRTFQEGPENDGYRAGLRAYDLWISALKDGKAQECGTTYNIDFWLECRRYAVDFFIEAQKRLGHEYDSYIEQTIKCYQDMFKHFSILDEVLPFPEHVKGWSTEAIGGTDERIPVAVEHLEAARDAEAEALELLAEIEAKL
jgi:hypothetical protein